MSDELAVSGCGSGGCCGVDQAQEAARLDDILGAVLGDRGQGMLLAGALRMLAMVDAQALGEGLRRIDRNESIGPLLNPTAFLDGRQWKNGRKWRDIIEAAGKLRAAMDRAVKP